MKPGRVAAADDYQRHDETEVGEHLHAVSGFRGARLLRHEDGREVLFTFITFFTSLDAVRGFAGDDYEQAVLEDAARQALNRWDKRFAPRRSCRVRLIDLSLRDIIAADECIRESHR